MIVIPMAGLSSRFFNAGYDRPKYMLEAHDKTLFSHSVLSFKAYFSSEKFVFIVLDAYDTPNFVKGECRKIGLSNYEVVILNRPTKGQAETVYLGLNRLPLDYLKDEKMFIFNIDTFRPGFKFPDNFDLSSVDGYLETFVGKGKNWSNIEPSPAGNFEISRTAEKQEISEYCCTGLYYFSSVSLYNSTFRSYTEEVDKYCNSGELYIAPMYNVLLEKKLSVKYTVIDRDQVIFCGVPEEFVEFKNSLL